MIRYGLVLVCVLFCLAGSMACASGEFRTDGAVTVYCPGSSRVHATALQELAIALKAPSADKLNVIQEDMLVPGSILLALIGDSSVAKELIKQGLINLHNVDPGTDAFECLNYNGTLCLLANTPRGLLQAVYELQEMLVDKSVVPADLHVKGTFVIPERIFHQRFDAWPGTRADVRYISHIGATDCLVTHDWQGELRAFRGYVTSPIFPNASDQAEVEKNHANLRRLLDDCADYGLDSALWITELPCQGGPWVPEPMRQGFLDKYPADVLSDSGTYQGKVLCFGHPKVQEYYRDLVQRFFKDFSEVSTIFVFGLDSGGEFCDPQSCPRCKGMSKFEQRDRLIRFLIEEGRKVRPGLRVLTTNWGWEDDQTEFLERQAGLPSESGLFMAAELDGWQPERQCHDLLRRARDICRERGQLFIGYDDFHWGDDSVHNLNDIQDYPLGIGAKLRRWHDLRVDGVFDHWGTWSQDISSNSIALRRFFINPLADSEAICKDIALKQFGSNAGPLVLKAWQSLEKAHAILSNNCTWPPSQWPMWYSGKEYAPTPEEFAKKGVGLGLKPKQSGPVTYNPPSLSAQLQGVSDAWRLAYPHYAQAEDYMNKALAKADDKPLFYDYWWSGEGSPSQKEHIRRQRIYLQSMGLIGREIGIHFGLQAIYEQSKDDPETYRREASALLTEDIQACKVVADYFELLRNAKDVRIDQGFVEKYRKKASDIETYLDSAK
ncbi:MAG: hypothetical protein ACYC64_01960 [Armatimonadota bacterium]